MTTKNREAEQEAKGNLQRTKDVENDYEREIFVLQQDMETANERIKRQEKQKTILEAKLREQTEIDEETADEELRKTLEETTKESARRILESENKGNERKVQEAGIQGGTTKDR